jgi:2-keto-4-pentenoate hydratase/2-oxohepta-3-ene-1,7-dioic acid hydratase in catechol pathway
MMRIATVRGRPVIVAGLACLDVQAASAGRFPADPLGIFERWDELRSWAAKLPADAPWTPFEPEDLGAPVPCPRQVFAVAVNYADHASEAAATAPDAPLVFGKFPSCITGPYDPVIVPSDRADWEVELVAVIGRRAEHVAERDAWDHVAGLTVGQDISERRVQFRKPGPNLAMAKSFPTFGPTGPVLVTPDEFPDRDALSLSCAINGETTQDANTRDMIFGVAQLIEAVSSQVILLPGDLLFTGTPSGVGSTRNPRRYLVPGDLITSEIEGIGVMRNPCRGTRG